MGFDGEPGRSSSVDQSDAVTERGGDITGRITSLPQVLIIRGKVSGLNETLSVRRSTPDPVYLHYFYNQQIPYLLSCIFNTSLNFMSSITDPKYDLK